MNILVRIVVNAIAIGLTAYLLDGIRVTNNSITTYLLLGVVFGLVNGLVKPIASALSCPLVILTLGLFVLVINGAMLLLTAWISGGALQIDGWWPAILAGIVMGIINAVLEGVVGAVSGGGKGERE
jgi:putative membrane protein